MREKLIEYVSHTMPPINLLIDEAADTIRQGLSVTGETNKAEEAATKTHEGLTAQRDVLERAIVEINEKHMADFSDDELEALNAFFRTDVRKKLMRVTAAINADIAAAVDSWRNETLSGLEPTYRTLFADPAGEAASTVVENDTPPETPPTAAA